MISLNSILLILFIQVQYFNILNFHLDFHNLNQLKINILLNYQMFQISN